MVYRKGELQPSGIDHGQPYQVALPAAESPPRIGFDELRLALTVNQMRSVMEAAGVLFITENGEGRRSPSQEEDMVNTPENASDSCDTKARSVAVNRI
jgi:hypothetical protein